MLAAINTALASHLFDNPVNCQPCAGGNILAKLLFEPSHEIGGGGLRIICHAVNNPVARSNELIGLVLWLVGKFEFYFGSAFEEGH